MNRKFQFSSDLFEGFTITIDIGDAKSISDIESMCIKKLIEVVVAYNFSNLIDEVLERDFNIPEVTFQDILEADSNYTFYVVDDLEFY